MKKKAMKRQYEVEAHFSNHLLSEARLEMARLESVITRAIDALEKHDEKEAQHIFNMCFG